MTIVLLDAMEEESIISVKLKERLLKADSGLRSFSLKDMEIQPCRSCGACGYKSPGKCVVKDDSHQVLKAIAGCDMYVLLTPIRFGGYNSILKKAIDKFMSLALPCYMVKDGRLLHPDRYGRKQMAVLGIAGSASPEQEKSFRKLVEHNALNLNASHAAIVLDSLNDTMRLEQEIDRLLKEVC